MKKKFTRAVFALFLFQLLFSFFEVKAQCNADFNFYRNTLINSVYFTNTSTPSVLLYSWSFGDNTTSNLKNPVKFYGKSDTFWVCLAVRDTLNTCFDTICKTVYLTQQAACNANFFDSINPTDPVGFKRFVPNSISSNKTYRWTFGDASAPQYSTLGNHTYTSSGTYNVCLYVSSGFPDSCFNTYCRNVNISIPNSCTSNFIKIPDPVNPLKHYYSANNPDTFVTYKWTFYNGDTLIGKNAVKNYPAPGIYRVCLQVKKARNGDTCVFNICKDDTFYSPSNTCTSTFTKILDPNNPLKRYYSAYNPDSFVTYKWTFYNGDTLVGKNAFKIYPSNGIYKVCLQVKKARNGDTCVFNICKDDTVSFNCKANFTAFQNSPTNPKQWFFNNVTPNTISTWNFDHGSALLTGNLITHVFPSVRTYNVCLYTKSTIDTTCRDTFCKIITVEDTLHCQANFQMLFTDTTNTKKVTLMPRTAFDSSATYLWTFADSSSANTYMYNKVFSNYGYQKVCLRFTRIKDLDTCVAQVCDSVYVGCRSYFIYNRADSLPHTVNFLGYYAQGLALDYTWKIGSITESNQMNFTKVFTSGGNKLVCLTVRSRADSNCTSTYCKSVYIPCFTNFGYSMDSINNMKVNFLNLSQTDTSSKFFWDFGDGQTSTSHNPIHLYANPGFYRVCLTITQPNFSCSSSKCDSVLVGAAPCRAYFVPNLTFFPTVSFMNLSQGASSATYKWSFGDGSFSSGRFPTHTYMRDTPYTVCLILRDTLNPNCADTFCRTINEDSSALYCRADFNQTFDSLYAGPGFRYYFNSITAYAPLNTQFLWTFGDGDSSTAKNPMHVFDRIGKYNVCLSIINFGDSCYKTDCISLNVFDTLTSLNQINGGGTLFKVFPNPFDNEIQIEFSFNPTENWNYELLDIQGRKIKIGNIGNEITNGKLNVSTADIPRGVYILQVLGFNQTYRTVLIK